MNDLNRDPIINVVHNGIKKGIRLTSENKCYDSAIKLIFCGIDAMAYLYMPEEQMEVKSKDFVGWSEKYINFPCKEQLSGLDLYGARCGVLHQHGPESNLSRQEKCRKIGYFNGGSPEVRYDPQVSTELVMVSIEGLVDAFFKGVDKFMIDLFSDKKTAKVAEERLKTLMHTLPYKDSIENKSS